jgi:WD40 repeat protein
MGPQAHKRHSRLELLLLLLLLLLRKCPQVKWNANGTWLVSASRDQTVRVWDIRHTKKELNSWQGHTREVHGVAWHPVHLELVASGACWH